jgi:hypothetical protein
MKFFKVLTILIILLTLVSCDNTHSSNPDVSKVPPVYQGMSVSQSLETLSNEGSFLMAQAFKTDLGINDNIPTLDIPEQENLVYYANRNEEIFVSVRLFNPEGHVILRFTLNGVIYQSFQFESGSNSQLLVIKVNSGNISGVKELTIDEIKYLENGTNTLRDAIFDGDKTIKIGVSYSSEVVATLVSQVVGSTHFQIEITIIDTDHLTVTYKNLPVFYLFDGTKIVYTKTLNVGANRIDYNNIHPNLTYEYAVATTYDLLDGIGKQSKISLKNSMTPQAIVDIKDVVSTQNSISFELETHDPRHVGQVTAIELYQGETLIESLTDLNTRIFNNLLVNNAYEIKVTYAYDLNDGNGIKHSNELYLAHTLPQKITINAISLLNTTVLKVGEEAILRLNIDNPSNANIKSFVINSQEHEYQKVNQTTYYVYVPIQTSSDELIVEFTGTTHTLSNKVYTNDLSQTFVYTLNILENMVVSKIYNQNENIIALDQLSNQVFIQFENVIFSNIESIVISYAIGGARVSKTYASSEISIIDEYTIGLEWRGETHFSNLSFTSIVYLESLMFEYNEVEITENFQDVSGVFYILHEQQKRFISSRLDFENIENGYYYVLLNDIDLSLKLWNSFEFHGVIDGNGYSIMNMQIVLNTQNTTPIYSGLFSDFTGKIKHVNLENIVVSINTNGIVYFGALVAYATGSNATYIDSVVEISNVSITGTINIKSSDSISSGGILGGAIYTKIFIENTFVDINTTYHTNYLNAGGFFGSGFGVGHTFSLKHSLLCSNTQITALYEPASFGMMHAHESSENSAYKTLNNHLCAHAQTTINNNNFNTDMSILESETLNNARFYIDTLYWDVNIWHVYDVDMLNKVYPKLKQRA